MSKKLLTFLTLLTLFFGVGWAETNTMMFVITGKSTGTFTGAPTGASASIITYGNGSGSYQIQKDAYKLLTISNMPSSASIKGVKVRITRSGNGTTGTVEVKMNDTSIGTLSLKKADVTQNSSSASASDDKVVSITETSFNGDLTIKVTSDASSYYVWQFEITYETGGSSSTLGSPSISFSSFTAGDTEATANITPGSNSTTTYFKVGENGTYAATNGTESIDLTTVQSPFTVYAYSSDGTNSSAVVNATFTLPALGVTISPSSYSGYGPKAVTITPTNYVGAPTITYTDNGGSPINYSTPFSVTTVGTHEIIATVNDERANGSSVTSSAATIEILETPGYNLPFVETFDGTTGKGGNSADDNGNQWGGNIATNKIVYDNEGWSVTNNWGGDACIRLGTSSITGTITSPTIKGLTIGETYTLTFKAAPWNTESTIMSVTASGATISGLPTAAMTAEQWNEFTLTLTATATTTTLTFSANNKRFWLDEVNVTAPIPEGDYYLVGSFNGWTSSDDYKFSPNSDGDYILNGITIPDGATFKIMKGSTWCGGPTDNTQYCEVTSGWHTDMGIIVDGGSNYHMASGGECYFTINPNFQLTVQKAPVAIRGTHNNWTNVAMTATETGWTIDNITLAETNEFQFYDGWGIYHGGAGAHILKDFLGVALDMGTSGNYYVTVPGKYTITVNRWLNKMTADVERNTHDITCTVSPNSGNSSVSVTVDGSTVTSAKYLDEVTIVPGPDNGYTLSSVVVTGDNSGNTITVTDNKFTMPDEDVTITATFEAGGYSITVVSPNGTTTCPSTATVGQTVTFTVTPNDGYTVNTVTASFEINNSTSPVTVSYNEQTGEYSFGMPPYPVTVTVTYASNTGFTQKRYQLITSASELEARKTYLIANYAEATRVLGHYDSSNNRGSVVTVSLDENDQITSTEDMEVITLGGQNGAWTLVTSSGNLGACSTSNGKLAYDTEQTATISFNDGEATIVFSGDYTRNVLCFNSTFFGCYQSSTGLGKVYLFKEVEDNSVKAPTISPEGGTFLNSQYPDGITVTITPVTDGSTIHVSTDGTNYTDYTAATTITVTSTTTITAYASKNGEDSEPVSETYNFTDVLIDPVVFSPIPGTYSGAQTLEMYSVNQNAKIYYEISDAGEPGSPNTSSTLYSNTDVINLLPGHTYQVKAIAYVGNNCSEIASGTYTITAASTSNLNSIAEMNNSEAGTSKFLNNPFQIIYMSTWRHDGYTPEFAYVRDNTGYGLIYFGNNYYRDAASNYYVDDAAIFEMGDWLPGHSAKATVALWSEGFHNEFGGSAAAETVTAWPTSTNDKLSNNPIIPEETTNSIINAGWNASNYNGSSYASGVTENNVWGHYVHLRKNTITDVGGAGNGSAKHYGNITDQSGVSLTYYDGFYNFSGYNETPDYNQAFFDNIQNNGGTFDVYAIVAFYGPYATDETHNSSPFEVFPIDFLYIQKPMFNITSGTYYEPKTVTITCATEGATIYYKTSDMEDYEKYTPGTEIIVDATTTIEAYSSIPTKYNDVMESVVNTLVINIGSIDAPVITEPSVVKTVGESVTTDITCATEDATIYYTTDGSDPKTSETRQVYNSDLTFEETTTVRAIAYKVVEGTGYYSAEAEARTYTFVKSNGIVYDLVTSNAQLNENSVYVIVNKANNMAVGTTQNENNRSGDGVMFVENTNQTKVYGNDELAQFTLKKIGNNWYMQTANSSENGYLYVGNGNTLLTSSTAYESAEATINIDADAEHQAHISFVYNHETTRYLRYWNGGQAFNTYTSETSNLPVSLYYVVATPLANIEKEGVKGQQYTVADQLIAVHYVDPNEGEYKYLWCKDQGNVSISKTEKNEGQTDYLREVAKVQGEWSNNTFESRDWDQSNWVVLKFETNDAASISNAVGKFIKPASITGHYTDDVNFTITMPAGQGLPADVIGGDAGFTPNVYCPANFLDANLNIGDGEGPAGTEPGERYFFMNPKIQEVATVTFAVWNGTCFVVPAKDDNNNHANVAGAFSVDWSLNKGGNVTAANANEMLRTDVAYKFLSVLNTVSGSKAGSEVPNVSPSGSTPQGNKVVYPLNLNGGENTDNIVTAIKDVVDVTDKTVAGVKYYNLAGIESDRPFDGVNIIVTTYTDGSRTSTKVLK